MFRKLKNLKEKLASSEKIDIHMVSALMMTKLCKDPGTPAFVISTANLILLQATAADTMGSIPAEYHDFCDVFSGEKVGTLAPHRTYGLQINVKRRCKTHSQTNLLPVPPRTCGLVGIPHGTYHIRKRWVRANRALRGLDGSRAPR